MSKIKRSPDRFHSYKISGDHQKYLERIKKTLYYGKLPKTDGLSLPVTELATEIFSETHKGKSLDRLHLTEATKISRNTCVPPCSLVIALLYLERLKTFNPEYVEKTSPSDLFLISLMVSCKFLFDDGESDEVFIDEWAASAGISIKELIILERNFLNAINWHVYVKELTFWKKLKQLETTLALKEGNSRGHFTYTELCSLFGTIDINNLMQWLVAVSVVLLATYTAGLLTLVGSVFLTSQVPGTSLYSGTSKSTCSKCVIDYNTGNESEVTYESADLELSVILNSAELNLTKEHMLGNWEYWNIPVMKWLADSSQFVTDYEGNYLKLSSEMRNIQLKELMYEQDIDMKSSRWYGQWNIPMINFEFFFWFDVFVYF